MIRPSHDNRGASQTIGVAAKAENSLMNTIFDFTEARDYIRETDKLADDFAHLFPGSVDSKNLVAAVASNTSSTGGALCFTRTSNGNEARKLNRFSSVSSFGRKSSLVAAENVSSREQSNNVRANPILPILPIPDIHEFMEAESLAEEESSIIESLLASRQATKISQNGSCKNGVDSPLSSTDVENFLASVGCPSEMEPRTNPVSAQATSSGKAKDILCAALDDTKKTLPASKDTTSGVTTSTTSKADLRMRKLIKMLKKEKKALSDGHDGLKTEARDLVKGLLKREYVRKKESRDVH